MTEIFSLAGTTDKGFRPPNMTTAQRDAIVAPQGGLMIFNTDTATWDYYTGMEWVQR